jgi:hypothetical protein
MKQHVQDLWEKIEGITPKMTLAGKYSNYRATLANDSTPEGTSAFLKIRELVDRELVAYGTVGDLVPFFQEGPWNNEEIGKVMTNLQGLNEYSNTVHYLFAAVIEKLGLMGEAGKSELTRISQEEGGFRGMCYAPNGGNSMPRVYLAEIVEKALQH